MRKNSFGGDTEGTGPKMDPKSERADFGWYDIGPHGDGRFITVLVQDLGSCGNSYCYYVVQSILHRRLD